MTTDEVRKKYLDFFKSKGHAVISPASLVPENDPSILFTNSGMSPLVPYLLGEKHPEGTRLTDSQPCFREVDIDVVGDSLHETFFEMLGNWSLGDYFKKEQLKWLYEFLIDELGLDINRLYQTVYVGDKEILKDTEAIRIIKDIYKKYGIEAEEGPETTGKGEQGPGVKIEFGRNQRIFAYRDKNWWKRGDAVGEPQGPSSETFYDTGKKHDPAYGKYCHVNCDCGRFIEIGNSVFMSYVLTKNGFKELEKKNVDFGGGLERIAMVHKGESNVFKIDVLWKLIEKIEELSGKKYDYDIKAFEVIADHMRAAAFMIANGVVPSNLAQGYILRRLIRRAVRYGMKLGLEGEFLTDIAEMVPEVMGDYYTKLKDKSEEIVKEIRDEEERFAKTLKRGMKLFEKSVQDGSLSGKEAFDLFATYGFPFEMTNELAEERGIKVEEKDFEREMEQHKEKSRTATEGTFKGGLQDKGKETMKLHTATHLLLAALRKVLGDDVYQKGSNITADRLRFDFSYSEKLTDEQKDEVERLVNEQIEKNLPVKMEEMTVDEAKEAGAMGVFESKYGEKVKVYSVCDFSKEICGGPHVASTGELGKFKIKKEQSSSRGVRRIKAVLE